MVRLTSNDYITYCSNKHNDKYDYSLTKYSGVGSEVIIICPEHGEFKKIARDHKNGQGCPRCSKVKKYNKYKIGLNEFLSRANSSHGNKYDYSRVEYDTLKDDVVIICPEHGEFKQRPDVHIKGEGCKVCHYKELSKSQRLTTKELVNKFVLIHGDKYDYSQVIYNGYKGSVTIVCSEHGEFNQLAESHLHGGNCPKCNSVVSKLELDIREYVKFLGVDLIDNDRLLLDGKELDVYIPTSKLAIEANGVYWHSDLFLDKDYHLTKTELCEKKGIQLIHIFEDEWLYKREIVKSRLRNILGLNENKVFARKCEIREVPTKEKTKFLNDNHIQGAVGSKVNLGLYYCDELVSLMTFGKRPILNKSEYELIRFCNKLDTSVVGGASKLLKHFIKTYTPREIISYADRRWSQGDLYENLGFEFIENTQPNWFIVNNGIREHRVKYQKHKLVQMGFDKNKTANQILSENGMNKIYDCGTKKYVLVIKEFLC